MGLGSFSSRFYVKISFLQPKVWICGSDVVEKFIRIFADDRFLVVAGHVVPCDSVVVYVVKDCQTRFGGPCIDV